MTNLTTNRDSQLMICDTNESEEHQQLEEIRTDDALAERILIVKTHDSQTDDSQAGDSQAGDSQRFYYNSSRLHQVLETLPKYRRKIVAVEQKMRWDYARCMRLGLEKYPRATHFIMLEDDVTLSESFYPEVQKILREFGSRFFYFKLYHCEKNSGWFDQHTGKLELLGLSIAAGILSVVVVRKPVNCKRQMVSFVVTFTVVLVALVVIGRMELYEILLKQSGWYWYVRAWSFCTPAVLYPRVSVEEVSEEFLSNERFQPYDWMLWAMDLRRVFRLETVGLMVQPNLVFHRDLARSTKYQ